MTTAEIISKAFFKGYGITFQYFKNKEDVYESRVLHTISDLKYNIHDEVLVGGCINMDGDYRQFFIDCMSKVKVYKYVDIAELSQ
jgi:agmatine/peptidylarginine deiminase